MFPLKTDQARTALQGHRTALDMRQRRLLILCDGQRDLPMLTALLGQDTPAMVSALRDAGYLQADAAPAAFAESGSRQTAAPRVAERRRSLAAARIYLLGILELQRHAQAVAVFGELQQSRTDDEILRVMADALRRLPALTSAGYAERVRQRLLEVLPLAHAQQLAEGAVQTA